MDSNDAEDGVAAHYAQCGRPFESLHDTNIQACSYQQDEDFSLRGARSCGDVESGKALDSGTIAAHGVVGVPIVAGEAPEQCRFQKRPRHLRRPS